jgi:lysophospholipase L1-like esterase
MKLSVSLRSFLALAAMLAWLQLPAAVQAQTSPRAEPWAATFGRAPAGPPRDADAIILTNQTLRLVAHTSAGGSRVRIRLSNEMGTAPLTIGAAGVALRQGGAQVVAGSQRALTFGGAASITVPPGAPALSDPVDLTFTALADLVVSVYLPAATPLTTAHPNALQTIYISQPGNFTAAATFPTARTTRLWPLLTEVDVAGAGGAIAVLGDSITDGAGGSADSNNRWPDWLARRLHASTDSAIARLGVVNRGISGNRLLTTAPAGSLAGRNGVERFDRDVLATAGVRYLVFALGINDISYAPASAPMTAALIGGYRQLLARARARGVAVIGATLAPFQGSGYYLAEREATRKAVNTWIRTSNELDGMIDFDRALQDPANPLRLNPAYDSGDHLHPNNFGYQAMADAVPLELFRAPAALPETAPPQETAAP